ncbi:MAG: hypothetical protein ACKV2V_23285, partial [Blastocatellia bacterium]
EQTEKKTENSGILLFVPFVLVPFVPFFPRVPRSLRTVTSDPLSSYGQSFFTSEVILNFPNGLRIFS